MTKLASNNQYNPLQYGYYGIPGVSAPVNLEQPYMGMMDYGLTGSNPKVGAGNGLTFGNVPMSYASPELSMAANSGLANFGGGGSDLGGGFLDGLRDFFKGAIGTKDDPGWGGMALGGLQTAGNMYMGMKQYGVAKDQMDESKRQFNIGYENNKNLTNNRLEDRQKARVASNAGAYESVGNYMDKYGVK